MKLVSIPDYDRYWLDAIFNAYKWDPQFKDNNTVAKHALVITPDEADELIRLTEKLAAETVAAETALNRHTEVTKPLALPHELKKLLGSMSDYDADKHVRLMRFDFHPVEGGGYAVSEVNSDVPGGFAEASVLPGIAAGQLGRNKYRYNDFGAQLICEIKKKIKPGGTVAFVHCTSYSDDRQVMQFLGDRFEKDGYKVLYMAADHLKFENRKAVNILNGANSEVDFIFRFTPIEWLIGIKPKRWPGYFDTTTPSCNHPVAIYAQTKRFPLVFGALETLGVDISAWRALLPETLDVKDAGDREGFIYKPACGRVGEGISIKNACSDDEYKEIMKGVKKRPKDYVLQKMFNSRPLVSGEGNAFHVCLGSYSIEGKAAGFYARISSTRRIDSNAADIPVLIEGGEA